MSAALPMPRLDEWRDEAFAALRLSWPMILGNLAHMGLTATDVVMMGWVGTNAVAAGALGSNIYFAFLMFGMGIMISATPMVARAIGAKLHSVREVRRTFRQGMWVAVITVLPMWAVMWQTETICLWLRQDPDLALAAQGYVRTLMWGLLPSFMFLVLRSVLNAMQRPLFALVIGLAVLPVNAALNWVFMFGNLGVAPMGLPGSGLATSLTALVSLGAIVLVVLTDRRLRRYHLFGRFWRADWPRFAAYWKLGLPIGAMIVFESLIFNIAAFMMGMISPTALAAHSIAMQIASMSFMVPLGLSQAVTVRVGLAYGRADRRGMFVAGWTAFALGTGFMVMMALVLVIIPQRLVGLFLDAGAPANAPTIALTVSLLGVAALFQVFDGAQAVAAGMLRGVQDTRVPMWIAAFGYWVIGFVSSVALAFGLGLGALGIWLGLLIALIVVSVLLIHRWLRLTGPGGRHGVLAALA